jgi:hypothetical protein
MTRLGNIYCLKMDMTHLFLVVSVTYPAHPGKH